MKKTTLLKTLFLLSALVVGSLNGWADDVETISADQFGFSSNTNLTGDNATLSATNFTLSFDQNESTTVPAYNSGDKEFRLYKLASGKSKGATITIASISDYVTFDKIEFTFSNLPTNYSFSVGTYNTSTNTWTGDPIKSLTLTNTDGSGQLKIKSMIIYYTETSPYTITATSNDNDMGSVSVSGTTITATPKSGYRVKAGSEGYTVTSGEASVTNNGDNTFSVTPSTACTIRINFEAITVCTVTLSDDPEHPLTEESVGGGVSLPTRSNLGDYTFVGWSKTELTSETLSATIIPTGDYYPNYNITLYPVYARVDNSATPKLTLDQTLQYDTWTYSGSTTDKDSYRMFSKDSYIISNNFDLSRLYQVNVYGGGSYGTLPDGDTRQFTISDGTTNWAVVTTTGTSSTTKREVTSDVSLSGTGKIRVISNCGAAGSSGLRISKVEILIRSYYYTSYPKATVTINVACTDGEGNYYGTYSNSCAFVVPEGLTVSAVGVDKGKLVVTDYTTGEVVKANTGVMVSATSAGDKIVNLSSETGTEKDGNLLKASGDVGITAAAMATAAPSCKYYRLTMHDGTDIGFWWGAAEGAAFALGANKAYLAVPNGVTPAHGLWLDDETTAINDVRGQKSDVRGDYFNLAGQRVAQPTKGLYIVNGKKVVIK